MPSNAEIRFNMLKQKYTKMLEDAIKQNAVDPQLINFLKKVNSLPKFFTASSCAGRIILLETSRQECKKSSKFIFKKHNTVRFKEIYNVFRKWNKKKKLLWFKQDPFILHIGTQDLQNAKKILSAMRNAGIKRGGIMVAKPGKFIIELQGTSSMSFLVKSDNFEICKKCFETQLKIANKKLKKNYARLKKFEREFFKVLKNG